MNIHYYVIDTETSGTKSGWHEVNQISIIRCSDRFQLNKYIKAEYPERVNPNALKYTNRVYADLLKGDSKEYVVNFCNDFFNEDGATPEQRCIIGHNIWNFDRKFLQEMWASVNQEFPANLWLDTIPYIKSFMKKKGLTETKHNLTLACQMVGVNPKPGAHNAIVDTQNNYLLWKALKETHKISTISPQDGTSIIKRSEHRLE